MLTCYKQDQFSSVFTNPSQSPVPNFIPPQILHPLPDFNITITDVVNAIDEIRNQSACPHTEIPAKVFKQCKLTLSKPLKLFWEQSFNAGEIPVNYKIQHVVPIYKKGSKNKAVNFRPI